MRYLAGIILGITLTACGGGLLGPGAGPVLPGDSEWHATSAESRPLPAWTDAERVYVMGDEHEQRAMSGVAPAAWPGTQVMLPSDPAWTAPDAPDAAPTDLQLAELDL